MRLIDADAFAEKLKQLHGYGDYEANMYGAEPCYGLGNWVWEGPEDYGVEAAEKALKEAPTIEAEPVKHGRWRLMVYNETPFSEDQCLLCTACGYAHCYDAWFDRCPRCGAKMEQEDEA